MRRKITFGKAFAVGQMDMAGPYSANKQAQRHYNTCVPRQHYEDPVAAYDRLAPAYSTFSKRRELYLRAVESEIVARIPAGARSLLDIGAGDGSRTARIAELSGITRVVLVEPSSAMAGPVGGSADIWRNRAEDLNPGSVPERFDVIACLWNVFGHVRGENRAQALKTMARFLSTRGRLFIDVNNRYNAKAYGWAATSARWLRDLVHSDAKAGDVTAEWNVGVTSISTYGHVFTHREIARLAGSAGLEIEERLIVDYGDGSLHRLPWLGNLLYVFRRTSRMDSSSAPATS